VQLLLKCLVTERDNKQVVLITNQANFSRAPCTSSCWFLFCEGEYRIIRSGVNLVFLFEHSYVYVKQIHGRFVCSMDEVVGDVCGMSRPH